MATCVDLEVLRDGLKLLDTVKQALEYHAVKKIPAQRDVLKVQAFAQEPKG
ncbi:MAG: hypothetical protein WA555_01465 [Candidatus Sulfotelmatobacter sp.]